jgi:glycosyltransferase involved in cell wall biosynthesis
MFEKIGATIADSNQFDVTIIGYPSSEQPTHVNIDFRPLYPFGRFSLKRLLAPWKVFQMINKVKPELIIINTPELLLVAFLNRIFYGRKIIYDVLENYYSTIRFTPAFPWLIRVVLAPWVRFIEVVSRAFVNEYFLAEKGYENELGFARPYTIIENKFPQAIALKYMSSRNKAYSKLIFTGTLAPTTGVMEAIHLCKRLHEIDSTFTLSVVGYCALPDFLNQIKAAISGADFIKLTGGDTLVPHSKILSEIANSDTGIIIYSVNPSTESSIPTKLYEYLAMKLPVVISHNEQSHQLVERFNAGIILTENPDYQSLVEQLKKQFILSRDTSVYWEAEIPKLKASLKI